MLCEMGRHTGTCALIDEAQIQEHLGLRRYGSTQEVLSMVRKSESKAPRVGPHGGASHLASSKFSASKG